MLRGHVDLLTSTVLAGWAVDLTRPNEPVDICIFVDGYKLAQLTCDHLREDLIGEGGLGNGRHGFRYNPYPPLTGPAPKRVTVRHASTGRILGKGDAVLHAVATAPPPDLSADLPPDSLRLLAPETPRESFERFLLYDRSQGLYNLLRQMDFS